MGLRLGKPRLVAQTEDVIGEIPVWNGAAGTLSWIDILKPAFHVLETTSGDIRTAVPPEKLGSYGVTSSGALIVGGRGGIALWEPWTGRFERLSSPEADRPDNILNDGRVGPDGRFVIASMDKRLAGPNGRMWQVSEGETTLVQDGDIFLPNAICWSPDGTTLYFGDSHTNLIHAYDYDLATGAITNRRLFADTSALPGDCDGASVDAEGYLWNARFAGGCLIRFAPDGSVDEIVSVPVDKPTHVTFGGPDLTTLYVTTARFRTDPADLARQPMAGGVIAIDGDVPGLAEPLYGVAAG
ncbi:SMP-30/gluconolactonase/LRE family protein [Acuticoccus mangrovi]|uniref:SMP-30/gluconolactonase/LRE family protein n=1 Tax=Acuticoccus mangrovi TaxID=2796142 RepID=A0A934IT18_9HYPH|nr:SMP-30/gluconolactonase/LRE family protein [Acuticoccus mangrovi]MBJ3778103.1 SMP-30/gluconolactonase/LRE family protein [Acuticoccus mangrovi]